MSELDIVAQAVTRLSCEPKIFEGVGDVADLAAFLSKGKLPERMPYAFVVPLGDDAAPAQRMTGAHRQKITERFGVVIMDRKSDDVKGVKARASITELRTCARNRLVNWTPGAGYEATGYTRSRFLGMNAGTVHLQADFSTQFTHTQTPGA